MSEDVGWFIFFECDVNSERAHLSTTHTLSECCLSSHTTPGQMGTGQKCPIRSKTRPSLDICAPKPHIHSFEDGESAKFFMRAYRERSAPKIKAADGVGRFDFRKLYLQFLQFLESEAFLEAFACLPDCALPLSLAAEDCLPFALDLVFSMFTPFGGSPRVQTFACRG